MINTAVVRLLYEPGLEEGVRRIDLIRADVQALADEVDRLREIALRAQQLLADKWAHADAPYEPVALEAMVILGEVAQ